MTVRQMRIRAKSHGLTGYSRMRKDELVALLDSIRHNVGDIVERAIDRKRGVVVKVEDATFDGVTDSTVIVQYDGEKREDATCGAHHAFVFIAKGERCTNFGAHAPHGMCKGIRGVADMCLRSFGAYGSCVRDKNHADKCKDAFGHEFTGVESLDKAEDLSKLDFMDLTHMVSVLNEFISNKGREDLLPIADKLDAFEGAADYRGGDSRIPGAIGCECMHESERCSTCVLNKLSRLFGFELDATEPVDVRPLVSAMYAAYDRDCYA